MAALYPNRVVCPHCRYQCTHEGVDAYYCTNYRTVYLVGYDRDRDMQEEDSEAAIELRNAFRMALRLALRNGLRTEPAPAPSS